MTDTNRIVQGLWMGGRLSALERLCVRSFCAHGHEFHLYHYDELENVPRIEGLRLMDAREVLPRAQVYAASLFCAGVSSVSSSAFFDGARNKPNSNNSQQGIASSSWDMTSGGVTIAAMTKAPTIM